jgi:predicted Zn-dependent protease
MKFQFTKPISSLFLGLSLSLTGAISGVSHAASSGYYLDNLDLPEIGDSSQSIINRNEQYRLGYNAYLNILRHGYVLQDPEANAYIQALGERVATGTNSPLGTFKFFIFDSPSVNAFAMPGGFIGVNVGLITLSQSESELASVIAHEINHVTQQHIARTYEGTRSFQLATAAAMIAAIALSGGDGEVTQAAVSAGLAAGIERSVNFTRAHEHEADRLAVTLLAQAGLDPQGMPRFFQRLERLKSNYSSELSGFLLTHPLTTTRVAEAQTRANHYPNVEVRESSLFGLIRERLRVHSVRADKNPLDLYPRNSSDIKQQYGYAMALRKAGYLRDSQSALKQLRTANEEHLLFHLDYLRATASVDSPTELKSALEHSHKLFPGNKLLAFREAEALLQLGQPREAREKLQMLKAVNQGDPSIHRMLAQSAAELHMRIDTHIHEADFYLYQGDTKQAEKQLRTALEIPELQAQEKARLQASLAHVILVEKRLEKR